MENILSLTIKSPLSFTKGNSIIIDYEFEPGKSPQTPVYIGSYRATQHNDATRHNTTQHNATQHNTAQHYATRRNKHNATLTTTRPNPTQHNTTRRKQHNATQHTIIKLRNTANVIIQHSQMRKLRQAISTEQLAR